MRILGLGFRPYTLNMRFMRILMTGLEYPVPVACDAHVGKHFIRLGFISTRAHVADTTRLKRYATGPGPDIKLADKPGTRPEIPIQAHALTHARTKTDIDALKDASDAADFSAKNCSRLPRAWSGGI